MLSTEELGDLLFTALDVAEVRSVIDLLCVGADHKGVQMGNHRDNVFQYLFRVGSMKYSDQMGKLLRLCDLDDLKYVNKRGEMCFHTLLRRDRYDGLEKKDLEQVLQLADVELLNYQEPKTGLSCLHIVAARGWSAEKFNMLVEAGADANLVDKSGKYSSDYVESKHRRNNYMEHCGPRTRQEEILHAVSDNDVDRVKALVTDRAHLRKSMFPGISETALNAAIKLGCVEMVKHLLQFVCYDGYPAEDQPAIDRRHFSVWPSFPITSAIGNSELLKLLLESIIATNAKPDFTGLVESCKHDKESLGLLLRSGFVDLKSPDIMSPFLSYIRPEIIDEMISAGVPYEPKDFKDTSYDSPIERSLKKGYYGTARYLLMKCTPPDKHMHLKDYEYD